jgi:hypothetical protein
MWYRIIQQTANSLRWREEWRDYARSLGVLAVLVGGDHWIHGTSVRPAASAHAGPPVAVPGSIVALEEAGLLGLLVLAAWLVGRFYRNAAANVRGDASEPWRWPWHVWPQVRRDWGTGLRWMAGFVAYWFAWTAAVFLGARVGGWGLGVAILGWALTLPVLILWTGHCFFAPAPQWRWSWRVWGRWWCAAWISVAGSVLLLGGLVLGLHPHTAIGLVMTLIGLLWVEFLLERLWTAWYLVHYWAALEPARFTAPTRTKPKMAKG